MAVDPESKEAVQQRLKLLPKVFDFKTIQGFALSIGGMTPQKWNNYTNGADLIPVDVALILCRKYGLSTDWIYRGLTHSLPMHLAHKIDAAEASQSPPKPRRASKTT